MYLLSLDGGGIKGILIAQFLYRLEEELGKSIYDLFDFFAGTSTGSFIVAAIVYRKMSPLEILEDLYTPENARKMMTPTWGHRIFGAFRPKYCGESKRELLKRYFSDQTISDTEKYVMFMGFNLTRKQPQKFTSWEEIKSKEILILDSLDISSAAPSYFPSVQYGTNKEWGVDGAICSNNPTDIAYAEAIKLFPNKNLKILSIGSGMAYPDNPDEGEESQYWGSIQWMTQGDLMGLLMESGVHEKMEIFSKALGHEYIRINTLLENTAIDDVSEKNIKILREIGDIMWENHKHEIHNFLKPLFL